MPGVRDDSAIPSFTSLFAVAILFSFFSLRRVSVYNLLMLVMEKSSLLWERAGF